jgi:hypothetical protein
LRSGEITCLSPGSIVNRGSMAFGKNEFVISRVSRILRVVSHPRFMEEQNREEFCN